MATVFLIDDDLDGCEAMAQFLEQAGHTVSQSADGHQALSAIPVILPEVIVLDVHMPRMDGFTFLRELRGDRTAAGIPVILVTGVCDPDLPWRAAQLGVERVFLKGDYELSELLACIENLTAATDAPPMTLQHMLFPQTPAATPMA